VLRSRGSVAVLPRADGAPPLGLPNTLSRTRHHRLEEGAACSVRVARSRCSLALMGLRPSDSPNAVARSANASNRVTRWSRDGPSGPCAWNAERPIRTILQIHPGRIRCHWFEAR
jgi:hypothetical protein